MKKKLILLSILLIAFTVGSDDPPGCSGTINGIVSDGNDKGIEGVDVILSSEDEFLGVSDQTERTDSNGSYGFNDVSPGTYSVTVSTGGYTQVEEVIVTTPDSPAACVMDSVDFTFVMLDLDKSMISGWDMDTSTGTATIVDIKGNNDGTFGAGAASPVRVEVSTGNYCLEFDGDDYVDLGTLDAFTGDTDVSVVMNVKFDSDEMSATAQLIDCNYATESLYKGFQLYLKSESGVKWLRFGCHQNDIFGYTSASSTTTAIPDKWYFIVGVRDHSGEGKFKLYIVDEGGGLKGFTGNDTTAGDVIDSGGNPHYSLGSHCLQEQGFFKGWIDDVQIYKKALTQNEVVSLYGLLKK